LTQRHEITLYERAFDRLRALAEHGRTAGDMIGQAKTMLEKTRATS
jgi:hypothetical protein